MIHLFWFIGGVQMKYCPDCGTMMRLLQQGDGCGGIGKTVACVFCETIWKKTGRSYGSVQEVWSKEKFRARSDKERR
ncbi:MAG: hypothetical protein KGI50_04925 [Patescibacteria group bacterium]|nr:hypothetical protein [Patescibacteria group bacterium]MDE2438617.1 hypothetical protein [Patescibacteria group bacterium]